jgi:hypothetical protein
MYRQGAAGPLLQGILADLSQAGCMSRSGCTVLVALLPSSFLSEVAYQIRGDATVNDAPQNMPLSFIATIA